MTTGVKVAIGCAAVAILGITLVVVGLGGAAWWAKGKVEQAAGEQDRIEQLHETANKNDFRRPADGLIAEARLQKFLDVRRRVYDVYKKYDKDLEARGKKEPGDLGDVTTAFGMINEIRLAQARAQADLGMSDDEYRYLVEQVYKTMWASEVAKSTGGKSVSEAAGAMYDQAAQAMARARRAGAPSGAARQESGRRGGRGCRRGEPGRGRGRRRAAAQAGRRGARAGQGNGRASSQHRAVPEVRGPDQAVRNERAGVDRALADANASRLASLLVAWYDQEG